MAPFGRFGGQLVALQTTEAVVPGSNPASLTVKYPEDRHGHCTYFKTLGQRWKPPSEAKNERKSKIKTGHLGIGLADEKLPVPPECKGGVTGGGPHRPGDHRVQPVQPTLNTAPCQPSETRGKSLYDV